MRTTRFFNLKIFYYYFTSAAVAVDSSHMTASLSASWGRFCPPSNFVSGHMSTVWFMVCCWPQSQEGDWARPHLCKFARRGPSEMVRHRPCMTREILEVIFSPCETNLKTVVFHCFCHILLLLTDCDNFSLAFWMCSAAHVADKSLPCLQLFHTFASRQQYTC